MKSIKILSFPVSPHSMSHGYFTQHFSKVAFLLTVASSSLCPDVFRCLSLKIQNAFQKGHCSLTTLRLAFYEKKKNAIHPLLLHFLNRNAHLLAYSFFIQIFKPLNAKCCSRNIYIFNCLLQLWIVHPSTKECCTLWKCIRGWQNFTKGRMANISSFVARWSVSQYSTLPL